MSSKTTDNTHTEVRDDEVRDDELEQVVGGGQEIAFEELVIVHEGVKRMR